LLGASFDAATAPLLEIGLGQLQETCLHHVVSSPAAQMLDDVVQIGVRFGLPAAMSDQEQGSLPARGGAAFQFHRDTSLWARESHSCTVPASGPLGTANR